MDRLSRRSFLKALAHLTLAVGGSSLGLYGYARELEPEWLKVERVSIPLPSLDPQGPPIRIAQLSDIHLHPHTQLDQVQRAVERCNALRPHLVVLTGDFVYANTQSAWDLALALAKLEAPQGLFAILGNHDYWTDPEEVQTALENVGVRFIINRGATLHVRGQGLNLAGLDDIWSGQPDLDAALGPLPPEHPTLLLCHEPDFATQVAADGRVQLQLSGHTHGGQVRIPGFGAPILPPFGRQFDQGLFQVGSMLLYVNRGLGVISPPVRVNCRPEVTLITLAAR
jgi:hypothetical protein